MDTAPASDLERISTASTAVDLEDEARLPDIPTIDTPDDSEEETDESDHGLRRQSSILAHVTPFTSFIRGRDGWNLGINRVNRPPSTVRAGFWSVAPDLNPHPFRPIRSQTDSDMNDPLGSPDDVDGVDDDLLPSDQDDEDQPEQAGAPTSASADGAERSAFHASGQGEQPTAAPPTDNDEEKVEDGASNLADGPDEQPIVGWKIGPATDNSIGQQISTVPESANRYTSLWRSTHNRASRADRKKQEELATLRRKLLEKLEFEASQSSHYYAHPPMEAQPWIIGSGTHDSRGSQQMSHSGFAYPQQYYGQGGPTDYTDPSLQSGPPIGPQNNLAVPYDSSGIVPAGGYWYPHASQSAQHVMPPGAIAAARSISAPRHPSQATNTQHGLVFPADTAPQTAYHYHPGVGHGITPYTQYSGYDPMLTHPPPSYPGVQSGPAVETQGLQRSYPPHGLYAPATMPNSGGAPEPMQPPAPSRRYQDKKLRGAKAPERPWWTCDPDDVRYRKGLSKAGFVPPSSSQPVSQDPYSGPLYETRRPYEGHSRDDSQAGVSYGRPHQCTGATIQTRLMDRHDKQSIVVSCATTGELVYSGAWPDTEGKLKKRLEQFDGESYTSGILGSHHPDRISGLSRHRVSTGGTALTASVVGDPSGRG